MTKHNIWIVGHHAVEAVLRASPERAIALSIASNPNNVVQQRIVALVEQLDLPIQTMNKNALTKLSGSDYHQGIALHASAKDELKEQDLSRFIKQLKNPLLLILDHVQDPHNFGACLRTADAAGVDAVIVAKDNAAPMTSVVQKVACGAAETLPIYRVTNLMRTMQSLKELGIWMIGTSDAATQSLYQENFTGAVALLMGAEDKGLRQLTEKNCDYLVSLPMAGKFVSSLNVSVATGVCLYEVLRQRALTSE